MIELSELQLPTGEQLEGYRIMRGRFEGGSDEISPEPKQAFCRLVLSVSPDPLYMDEVKLAEKFYPINGRPTAIGIEVPPRIKGSNYESKTGDRPAR